MRVLRDCINSMENAVNCSMELGKEIVRQVLRVYPDFYEKLKIFINHSPQFLQVRFFHQISDRWKDCILLNGRIHYYEKMIVLHGYITLIDLNVSGALEKKRIKLRVDWLQIY